MSTDAPPVAAHDLPAPDAPARPAPSYEVAALRSHFPMLDGGAAHFDGPGGSQTPDVVVEAISGVLSGPLGIRGSDTAAARNGERAVQECRHAMADLLGGSADTVIFGRSMTALTFEMSRTLSAAWGPGDEVVVSRLDHDANIRPWVIAAGRAGATVRWAEFDPATGELDPASVGAVLTDRTVLVAVTAASNLIGTMPDLAAIADLVHEVGALFYVDGVHYTPHAPVDVAAMGADFFACSPYKFLGPHCGTLIGRADLLADLHPDKLLPSVDSVPERFELGTLPYELMAGTTAAVDLLASLVPGHGTRRERLLAGMQAIGDHERRLRQRIEAALIELPGVTIHSRARRRTPTLLATFEGRSSIDISRHLAGLGVNAPSGSFYALEASRFMGLGDDGGLRIGVGPYTDDSDVDRLLEGLNSFFA